MSLIDFRSFSYFPAFRCSKGEHNGYVKLSDSDKKAIIPIAELDRQGKSDSLAPSIHRVKASIGDQPFILDLCKDYAPEVYISKDPANPEADKKRVEKETASKAAYDALIDDLLNPNNGFENWRAFAAKFQSAIPAVLYRNLADELAHVIVQAYSFAKEKRNFALRFQMDADDMAVDLIKIITPMLTRAGQMLIVIDCGQGRINVKKRATVAKKIMEKANHVIGNDNFRKVRFVCMSSSFTQPKKENLEEYECLDWDLWALATSGASCAFGDYMSVYRPKPADYISGDIKPTVVCPLDDKWLVYRHKNNNDVKGWRDGAQIVMKHIEYAPAPDVWGIRILERTARDDKSFLEPKHWIAVKVNIHVHRQIKLASSRCK
ncbi:hypothetical protein GBZ26_06065 [Azospirillum formosense]|uniref:T4 beta protein n=1 Tax=Azospirillum formosense TaxID=861533 RepID=A0ABX2KZ05_9PROT|nr:hypothetical protein [Azospirillum formosense]MBY3754367.1 hypothetical protein [Azospirillum formosense]NUB18778.1 hypothetical protein [Azospirillum formosense]